MSGIERLTITLPAEMAAVVKSAVETGDYASTSEVVRAALRDLEDEARLQSTMAALKADIDTGLLRCGRKRFVRLRLASERATKRAARPPNRVAEAAARLGLRPPRSLGDNGARPSTGCFGSAQ